MFRQLRITRPIIGAGSVASNDRPVNLSSMPYVVRILRERNSVSVNVGAIVELCRAIHQMNRDIVSSRPKDHSSQMSKLRSASSDLNQHLAKYLWSPQVSAYPGETPDVKVRFGFRAATHDEQKENKAVEWLIRHIEEVDRIRRCQREPCSKWFWAATDPQKFCSDSCRKISHSQSSSAKKNRAEYMRKYRKDEKERAESAIKLAGGNRK